MSAPPASTLVQRARIRAEAVNAARIVMPVWPLSSFVAVNPLHGLVDLGFERATAEARTWLRARTARTRDAVRADLRRGRITEEDVRAALVERLGARDDVEDLLVELVDEPADPPVAHPPRTAAERHDAVHGSRIADQVDAAVATACAAYAGAASARWRVPGHGEGLWSSWRRPSLPDRYDDGLLLACERLGLDADERPQELRGQLCRLPGWAGYARWCDEWAGADAPVDHFGVVEYLAVRLTAEADALDAADPPGAAASAPVLRPGSVAADPAWGDLVLLEAYERRHRLGLLRALQRLDAPVPPPPPDAQVVFCIDVRSEGLRRHLEQVGPYETLGFAGFFAVPVRYRPWGSQATVASCPVLLTPEVEVPERGEDDRSLRWNRLRSAVGTARSTAAGGVGSAFAYAEAAGFVLGPLAAARTLGARPPQPPVPPRTRVDIGGFTVEDRVAVAETALRTMGLTSGFAPLVVLCGHGSTTVANPHFAALDCGACGGNRGGPNARAAAAILNDPATRSALVERGITVPEGTVFVAAEHDTTLDRVTLMDVDLVPTSHRQVLDALDASLTEAADRLAAERAGRLPGGGGAAAARRRATDWAQVRPEWGLAGNAAFIVGHRRLTRDVDLGCRAFLHSYDRDADVEGTALETILTAPMVVAQWINAQYYFSTVDPEVYGAGDKTLHNPIGTLGVLAGPGGDLRVGLPLQSVAGPDGAWHEPMRLLAVVDAPLERIDRIVERNAVLRHLFGGSWVTLVAPGTDGTPWLRRRADGRWVEDR